jgi:hypothetical protein
MSRYAGRRYAPIIVAVLTSVLLLFALPGAANAEGLTFNPTLSLTGDCSVKNKVDQVPDPGCPGGSHPGSAFNNPGGVSTDSHGDVYVFNQQENEAGTIDVFTPDGHFITEAALPSVRAATVDSNGVIYVWLNETPPGGSAKASLARLEPSIFEPASGSISYGSTFTKFFSREEGLVETSRIAIDPSNGHVFAVVNNSSQELVVREWGSAQEGNPDNGIVVGASQLAGKLRGTHWLSVGSEHRLLASGGTDLAAPGEVLAFSPQQGGGYALSSTLTGPTQSTKFSSNAANGVTTAVDTATGDIFVNDVGASSKSKAVVYQFDASGTLLATIKPPAGVFEFISGNFQIAVDNGSASPHQGNLLVPSSEESPGHLLVFEAAQQPPQVESLAVSGITDDEAQAIAIVQGHGAAGTYRFEIITQAAFAEHGWIGASSAGAGSLPEGGRVEVLASLVGLSPETAYEVRVQVAAAGCTEPACESEAVTSFATFPAVGIETNCPNPVFRGGASAGLPDCRAYELVSPGTSGGHQLVGPALSAASGLFATPIATSNGENVAFTTTGGTIPGLGGIGGLFGSTYLAHRTASGWTSESLEPSGAEATSAYPGALSPDHTLFTETVLEGAMQLLARGEPINYIRTAGRSFELLGGSLATEPQASVLFVSPGDGHVFFSSGSLNRPAQQLEPDAPASGTPSLYDRTPDGATHAVSVLPGNTQPPASSALHSMAFSQDGSVASFRYNATGANPLYVRVDGTHTLEAAPPGSEVEGLSDNGDFLFYSLSGNLFRYAVRSATTEEIVGSGNATVVNIAGSGQAVYFISPSVLDGGANSRGSFAAPGEQNLYLWRGGGIRYVATVTPRDVTGGVLPGAEPFDGLGLWQRAIEKGTPAIDPSQTTTSGMVLLFSSRAPITGYDSKASSGSTEGEAELFRYDAGSDELLCVSCDPTGQRPQGPASLASLEARVFFPRSPLSTSSLIPNLAASGGRVAFQTTDSLVPEDSNGEQDVYEWEQRGVGSCRQVTGCISLLSTGASSEPSYLFAASSSGNDVFILTSDQLVAADTEATASIYDARVDGGIAEQQATPPCEGEGCRQPLAVPPTLAAPGSTSVGTTGNAVPHKPKKKAKKKKHAKRHRKGHAKAKAHGGKAKNAEGGRR